MKKQSKGFTLVELLVVIGILGILMGALFPAISSAMLSANTSAMSMRGRNLFVGITQANTEREAAGLTSVWPHQSTADGLSDDSDDIAGNSFQQAEKYFEALFDIGKYGQEGWSPYVSGVDIGVLSGSGVPAFTGGTTLPARNVAWHVVSGITDEMEDIVPVFISKNADVSKFPTSAGQHDMSGDKDSIKLGERSPVPFGNKAMIVIHKGGAASVSKAKYAKPYLVYNKQTFTVPNGVTMKYLEVSASN